MGEHKAIAIEYQLTEEDEHAPRAITCHSQEMADEVVKEIWQEGGKVTDIVRNFPCCSE